MADYNVTALMGKLQRVQDNPEVHVVPDESINAGIEPLENIDDRVLEVSVPQSTIDSALPVSDAPVLEARAIESSFRELAYLRDDMRNAHGMTQELALEAIAIKPSFGNHRPINHYTSLPSQTYYKVSLEEIDLDMKADLLRYLGEIEMNIGRTLEGITWNETSLDQWTAKANALAGFAAKIDDLQKSLEAAGLNWDEPEFAQAQVNNFPVGYFVDPTTTSFVKAMHKRNDYFTCMLAAHHIGEAGRIIVQNWIDDLAKVERGVNGLEKSPDLVPATLPSIKLPNGKSIKIDDAISLSGLSDIEREEGDELPLVFRDAIAGFGSSALAAGIEDIINDFAQQQVAFHSLLEAVKSLKTTIANSSAEDGYYKVVMKYAKDLFDFVYGFGRNMLNQISAYVGAWDGFATQMIAYGMYIVEGANELVKAKAPAELTTGADLRNRWDEQVNDLRATAAVVL